MGTRKNGNIFTRNVPNIWIPWITCWFCFPNIWIPWITCFFFGPREKPPRPKAQNASSTIMSRVSPFAFVAENRICLGSCKTRCFSKTHHIYMCCSITLMCFPSKIASSMHHKTIQNHPRPSAPPPGTTWHHLAPPHQLYQGADSRCASPPRSCRSNHGSALEWSPPTQGPRRSARRCSQPTWRDGVRVPKRMGGETEKPREFASLGNLDRLRW